MDERIQLHSTLQEDVQHYKEVRGLSRGLDLLRALNSTPGGAASTSALANACGIHRTTAKRLLETLRNEGLVHVGHKDGFYMLSEHVLQLSRAMQRMAWVSSVVTPVLQDVASRLMWPCDFATYEAGQMVVRETTLRWCRMARHASMVGECIYVMRSSLGRAYLAACPEPRLQNVLAEIRNRADACGELARDERYVQHLLQETRERGHAVNQHRRTRDAVVAVAVEGRNAPLGALNLAYPGQLVSDDELRERFLPLLRDTAARIASAYEAWRLGEEDLPLPGRLHVLG